MKKNIILILVLHFSTCSAINLNEYKAKILDGRNQLIDAIKGLKAGKEEISKIYSDQLKPQLLDVLDTKIKDTDGMIKGLKSALDPLTSIPDIVKTFVAIGDLEPTLKWIIENPLAKVQEILSKSKDTFQPIAQMLIPPSDDVMAANKQKINDIYAQADKLENPAEQATKRKEADDYLNQLKPSERLYARFDLSITKLQSAVCKIEKTSKALKTDFTPSPECGAK